MKLHGNQQKTTTFTLMQILHELRQLVKYVGKAVKHKNGAYRKQLTQDQPSTCGKVLSLDHTHKMSYAITTSTQTYRSFSPTILAEADENFIINPLTVRTATWRFGLISSCGSNRTIILNFYCTFYHPMRLS